jgi:restriction system protein
MDTINWRTSQVSPLSSMLPRGFLESFVARDREFQAIDSAYGRGVRHVAIVGMAGTGKSTLSRFYASRAALRFPGGAFYSDASFAESPQHLWTRVLPPQVVIPTLLVVDEADAFDEPATADFLRLLREAPEVRVLLTGRRRPAYWPDLHVIDLGGFTQEQFESLWRLRNAFVHEPEGSEVRRQLYELAEGNPAFAALAIQAVHSRTVNSWDDLFAFVRNFETPGLFGPDGQPLSKTEPDYQKIIVDVSSANDRVIEILKRDPALSRQLPPRRFEEIVGELLEKQGYDVTLTPISRDGGFDIYAAKKDGLGAFLYVVECKRYTPPNNVGVEIVRSLYGVVQASRATAGAIVTTSFFTSGAEAFRRDIQYQMQLHDYIALQKWIREFPLQKN